VKQIAIADKILVTKTDLTSADHLETLCGRIRQLNSQSPIEFIRQGEVDPKSLIDLGLSSSRASLKTLQFLGEALNDVAAADVNGTGRYLGQRSATHNSAVKTLSLRFTEPFEWLAFSSALELLTTLRGPDLLRLKGIINVDGDPVVIQGVQHIIDTPVKMDRWPSDDKDTRLVFIVRNMELDVVRNLFQAVGAIKSAPLSAT
jgi:G3E family GTPase